MKIDEIFIFNDNNVIDKKIIQLAKSSNNFIVNYVEDKKIEYDMDGGKKEHKKQYFDINLMYNYIINSEIYKKHIIRMIDQIYVDLVEGRKYIVNQDAKKYRQQKTKRKSINIL